MGNVLWPRQEDDPTPIFTARPAKPLSWSHQNLLAKALANRFRGLPGIACWLLPAAASVREAARAEPVPLL